MKKEEKERKKERKKEEEIDVKKINERSPEVATTAAKKAEEQM